MKLEKATISNFRSFGGSHTIDLSQGVNSFVGPNNCGKSNLFSAIALAMDTSVAWNRDADTPSFMLGGRPPVPRIELQFRIAGTTGPEQTLLNRADAYERRVNGSTQTYASKGQIRLVFTVQGGNPQRYFIARGAGSRFLSADDKLTRDLFSQFHKVVRFVVVRSGESLESLLAGRFREILQLVMNEHLADQMSAANQARTDYEDALRNGVLSHLRSQVTNSVKGIFSEINNAELIPGIPLLSETLANVDVQLSDAAITGLLGKGTGLRGAVLLAIMQYLADQTKRSLILAIEEPEAFLHPSAQLEIKENLESLANRVDVTLLLTTHSPFILSNELDAQVVALGKDDRGCTSIIDTSQGDDDKTQAISGLFRDEDVASVIASVLSKSGDNSRPKIITEGYTDAEYLRTAIRLLGQESLSARIEIVPSNGTNKQTLEAILLKSSTSQLVLAMFDNDINGRNARDLLKKFQWSESKDIVVLPKRGEKCQHDHEVEDMWPTELLESAITANGGDDAIEKMERCHFGKHLRLSKDAKVPVMRWIAEHATQSDCSMWQTVIDDIIIKLNKANNDKDSQHVIQ
jgi:ABC-type nitrate/sulfonate/bicarbonate transport system ATPase subunit